METQLLPDDLLDTLDGDIGSSNMEPDSTSHFSPSTKNMANQINDTTNIKK